MAIPEDVAGAYGNPDSVRSRMDLKILEKVYDAIAADVKGPRILEMGFGEGVLTELIVRDHGRSHIVDASETLLARAKGAFGESVVVHHAYFEDFTPDERFDSILCTHVLEHVDDPIRCLARAREWLSPLGGRGGEVLVVVPNALSYHREMGVAMGLFDDVTALGEADVELAHKRVYTPERLEEDLSAAGLRVVANRNIMFKPLPYSILEHCGDRQLDALFAMDGVVENRRRAMLYYLCVKE